MMRSKAAEVSWFPKANTFAPHNRAMFNHIGKVVVAHAGWHRILLGAKQSLYEHDSGVSSRF